MARALIGMGLAVLSLLPGAPAGAQELDPYGMPVGGIWFKGLHRTRTYIVMRELETKVGEPCSEQTLREDVVRLINLDIFSTVQTQVEAHEDSAYVTYEFVETFPFLPGISISITDENGVSAGGSFKSSNLQGKDIFFSGRLLVGGATTAEAWLENPWFAGKRLGYRIEYAHRNRVNQIANFNETANELYLYLRSAAFRNLRLGGALEFINLTSDKDSVTLSPTNTDNLTRFVLYAGWDSRDSKIDPRNGWNSELAISRELRIFENSSSFTQLDFDLRRYQQLPGWDRHNLGIFALTTVRSGVVGQDVASWQRFGVGGTNTVRGWEYAARLGKNQMVGTLEYRATVVPPRLIRLPLGINYRGGLQVAAFGDVGIGWDTSEQFRSENVIAGGGLGVRLLVPIVSMLRFDIGWGQTGVGCPNPRRRLREIRDGAASSTLAGGSHGRRVEQSSCGDHVRHDP